MKCMNSVPNIFGPSSAARSSPSRPGADLVIRYARPDEADAIAELAQLDSSRAPRGTVIVADVKGELWAAVSVDDSHAVANPFRPSGELTFTPARARSRGPRRRARPHAAPPRRLAAHARVAAA